LAKRLNYDDYIGKVYEDKWGDEWKVLDVYRKLVNKSKRTVCLCRNVKDGKEKEVRLDSIKKYKGKKRNKYKFNNDVGFGYTEKGEYFIFDKEDYHKIKDYYWYVNDSGYIICNTNRVRLHRLVMDVNDSGVFVDHIHHKKWDNRKSQLRITDNQHNSMNINVFRSNTGVIGVHKLKNGRFNAYIKYNYNRIDLGDFDDIDDAIKVRLNAEKAYFKEFAPQKHLFQKYGIEGGDVLA